MRRLPVACGVGLVVAGLVWVVYPYAQDLLDPVPTPPQPVVASVPWPSDSFSPTATQAPTVAAKPSPSVPTALQPAANAVPAWLSVPSIGIDESVLPQGLNAAGDLEPPPGQTIWYTGSARPGQTGISVIAGHVQWGAKPDNFWRLADVPDGAVFSVKYSDGTLINFVVVSHESELKDDVMHDPAVWGVSAMPVQILVTCDKNSKLVGHHYLNNLIVFAKPVLS